MVTTILIIYFTFVSITGFMNAINATRIPNSMWDMIKLTFFPYVVYCLLFNRSKLK